MSEPTIEDYAKRQAVEYGQYIANGPIYLNGALAYTEGQAVPASNVEAHGYLDDGQVRRVGDQPPAPQEVPAPPQGQDIVLNPTENHPTENED